MENAQPEEKTTPQTKLNQLTFVTGNENKLREVREILGNVVKVESVDLQLSELQGTPIEVARAKAVQAFKKHRQPLICEDTSLCFNAYGGMPGAYIKDFLEKLKPEGLAKMAAAFEDRSAYAQCIFSFVCSENEEPVQFIGKCDGKIVEPRGENKFGWDPCFQPNQPGEKTFSELTPEEKNKVSHRGLALEKL